MERMSANGCFFHRSCFRCTHCNCQLKIGGYSLSKGESGEKGKFFCTAHYRQLFMSNPEAIGYQRADAKDAKREESRSEVVPRPQSKESSPTAVDDEVFVNIEAEKDVKKKSKSKKKSVKESKSEKKEASSEGGDKKKEVEGGDNDKKKKRKDSKKKQKKSEVSEEEPIVIIEPPSVVKDEDSPRARSASMVKTLSQGFEQLEKHAKTTEILQGTEGR